ncbi:hypothetical protein FYZ48_16100 [Gimesia chilikensis]|uniref:hypothetical protein n=1 Tax=Gimesia chilikensis TaxID=2605989 RepID=UPI0011EC0374|nr:hypothetical protein [Gimesia chilikensis]KAA0136962.1 hypothetical protein FYZ48_16100 [Gimesia chilikensis]
MMMIVYVALGVVLGFVLLILLVWFWLKWKFRSFAARFAEEFASAMAQMGGMAPPLRIDLEPLQEADWSDSDKADLISETLAELGYEPDGLFEAYAPLQIEIQGFRNSQSSSLAALYEIKQMDRLCLDLVADLSDGTHITVSNAEDKGLDHPQFSRLIRLDHLDLSEPDQVREMHARLLEELQGETTVDLTGQKFEDNFESFWAREMDWRMERGGVTTEEVIRISARNGEPEPSEEEIELAKRPWKQQIDNFITDQIRKDYLNNTNMSGKEWEETLDRLVIVHEHSEASHLIDTLTDTICYESDLDDEDDDDEEDPYLKAEQELNQIFRSEACVMNAFHRALDLLPPDRKYTLQTTTESPWKSEIYLSPKYYDEY